MQPKLNAEDLKLIKNLVQTLIKENNELIFNEFQNFKKEMKGDVYQFKDDILKEIQDIRADITVLTGYREMIEDHENRIHKLEKKNFSVKAT